MTGLLLDTHALFWLISGEEDLAPDALVAIGLAQDAGALFVSPISAWELAIASQKPAAAGRPNLGAHSADRWFSEAVRLTSAKVVPVRHRIALEAARVVTTTGHRDPGDCYLIATARMRRVPIATRDGKMQSIAADDPAYLSVTVC